jgi:hypothetical protein
MRNSLIMHIAPVHLPQAEPSTNTHSAQWTVSTLI